VVSRVMIVFMVGLRGYSSEISAARPDRRGAISMIGT
jgi:hypothetical protein